ncbi:hypothetical protein RchiOBHm_Chr1g0371501 [Rosa chinensis]|uniref:Uncharacterized protein n=2 Tax=Rosa chinensis TaxID=74649 RepID=A0A2P6SLI7_ROSCH|nr:hypothetical protein RchiOBHm_Chr1g0371501 [Rosa chinensis]
MLVCCWMETKHCRIVKYGAYLTVDRVQGSGCTQQATYKVEWQNWIHVKDP